MSDIVPQIPVDPMRVFITSTTAHHRRTSSDPDSYPKRREMIRLREPSLLRNGQRPEVDSPKRIRIERDSAPGTEPAASCHVPRLPSKLSIESYPEVPSTAVSRAPPTPPETPPGVQDSTFDCAICSCPMTDPAVGGGW